MSPANTDLSRRIPNNENGLFLYLNTNKYGVTLDPTKPAGKEFFSN